MTKFKRCILHIGGEKTGSTSLQAALWQSRASLLEQGIYTPDRGVGAGNAWGFVAIGQKNPAESFYNVPLSLGDAHEDRVARLQAQYEADFTRHQRKCDQLLVSSEHLQTRVDSAGIKRLLGWIASIAEECVLVYVARRQDFILRSLYSTALRAGSSTRFLAEPINFDRAQSPRLNHWIAVTRYLACAEALPVTTRAVRYEEDRPLRPDFWKNLLEALEIPTQITLPEQQSNKTLGLRSTRFLTSLLHPLAAEKVPLAREERMAIIGLLENIEDPDRLQPSAKWARNVLNGYKHSNWLFAETLLGSRWALFDFEVSAYPTQPFGAIGMTHEEFQGFVEESPELATLLADKPLEQMDAALLGAIRDQTVLG